jgi:hypothetical protein
MGCEYNVNDGYSHNRGFTLQRFDIINNQLNHLLQGVKDSTMIKSNIQDPEKIILLNLIADDSKNIELSITSVYKDRVSKHHIFNYSTRIVGYITIERDTLIVLSNVFSQFDFEATFYKFIKPTTDTQYVDYIYFPDDLYNVDETGIPFPPLLYNPYYYWYIYEGGQFVFYHHDEEQKSNRVSSPHSTKEKSLSRSKASVHACDKAKFHK